MITTKNARDTLAVAAAMMGLGREEFPLNVSAYSVHLLAKMMEAQGRDETLQEALACRRDPAKWEEYVARLDAMIAESPCPSDG